MTSMTTHTAVADHEVSRSECWCCGTFDDPARMIHLGDHPEVALCVRCGYWAAKQAWEIEDRGNAGLPVIARSKLRALRRTVIEQGWHRNRFVGRPLRWIGKRLP